MQIVSIGDNLHEMSNAVFWEKNTKNIINLFSAKLAQRVVKVNGKIRKLSFLLRTNLLICSYDFFFFFFFFFFFILSAAVVQSYRLNDWINKSVKCYNNVSCYLGDVETLKKKKQYLFINNVDTKLTLSSLSF